MAVPPLPPVYDSVNTYESPWGIGGARHYPFGYEKEKTKEVPKGIGDTVNIPQCMIVKTRTKALGGIGGLANILSDMNENTKEGLECIGGAANIPRVLK